MHSGKQGGHYWGNRFSCLGDAANLVSFHDFGTNRRDNHAEVVETGFDRRQCRHFSEALALPSAQAATTDCQGLAQLAPGDVLVLGEVHGIRETPPAFVVLVDRLLTRAKVASVGLEMPPNAGGAGCVSGGEELGRFWTRKTQDGRSSEAMRAMVCQLKERAAAGKIRLLYLDSEPRDADEMVRRARTEAGSKLHPLTVLIGNYHARNVPDSFVGRLRTKGLKVTSLTVSSPDATTWNCKKDGCAARPIPMRFCQEEPRREVSLTKAPAGSRGDGCMSLARLTSSPPANAH